MSAQDAAASALRTGTPDPPRRVVCDFMERRKDSQAAAPDSSRRLHGAPTFGVARCFFCIEKDLTVVSLWRKTSAAAARKRPGQLVAAFYPELRRIAARQIRKRADAAHVATHRCAE